MIEAIPQSGHNLASPISNFYSRKSVLVSGATGFIGKVLIEKILYSCPDVDKIFLLIRSSKGKSPHERMAEMISKKPFDIRLKNEFILNKLVAIDSDLSEPGLKLSESDSELLSNNVSIVFHVAASVKFEAPLELNMRHNVVATKELLELACNFKKLVCFVHVSTAYSNCQLRQIDERIYPMDVPEDPLSLNVTKEMIDNRPNTYTYTKAMAENVASKYASRMNVVIVRPSIVMSSLMEPAEGWVDTINGPVGLSVLGALGILQKIKVNSEVVFDLIPVDIVTNALVSIAWASTEKRSEFLPGSSPNSNNQIPEVESPTSPATCLEEMNNNNNSNIINNNNNNEEQSIVDSTNRNNLDDTVRVFNLTTGSENPCSFYDYFSIGREEAYRKPSTRALRPLLTIPKQKVDTLLSLFGFKKMVIKAVNRMHHANEVFDYFCSNQWTFVTDNVKKLRELQTPDDKKTFNCDVRAINWVTYAQIGWLGCRRFILNESDDTFAYAKRRLCISSQAGLLMVLMPIYGIVYLL